MEERSVQECFVIMPISEDKQHGPEHFKRVYEDILKPACDKAGFKAVRADDVKKTSLIHLDILDRLLESPMAICDLSMRNPNVLFELGIRQAFDKPTVLIQEVDTPQIFDIAPLKYYTYRKSLMYREVLEDQIEIAKFLSETENAYKENKDTSSIVRFLSINKAAVIPDNSNIGGEVASYVISEINELRKELRWSESRGLTSKRELNDNKNFRYILLLLDELREMLSNGTPIAIIKQNYLDINDRIQNISDNLIKSSLSLHLEEINREIEKFN